ncbi:MAG: IS1 family transposase [Bacteroidia bacterium]|nr:IS1 family transposase [Bacteroidia bacterium]
MDKDHHTCSRNVDGKYFVKNGTTNYGKQRYKCKGCGKTFVKQYSYQACKPDTNNWILNLVKEGTSVRSTSRLLNISPTTVIVRVLSISQSIKKPYIALGKSYEMDELATYIQSKNNRIWVAYAIRLDTKEVVNFVVGKRTNRTLRCVTNTLVLAEARSISTDKLQNYRSLIPESIHTTKQRGINHIERKNLSLRTHVKRLSRRTICFSRSLAMLIACLKIYFWG